MNPHSVGPSLVFYSTYSFWAIILSGLMTGLILMEILSPSIPPFGTISWVSSNFRNSLLVLPRHRRHWDSIRRLVKLCRPP